MKSSWVKLSEHECITVLTAAACVLHRCIRLLIHVSDTTKEVRKTRERKDWVPSSSFGPLQMGQGRALVLKIALVVIFCLQGGHQLQGLTGAGHPSQGWSWPLCFFREYNVSWTLLKTLLLIGSGHEARRVSLLLPSAPPISLTL
jgi:hypothetical protein